MIRPKGHNRLCSRIGFYVPLAAGLDFALDPGVAVIDVPIVSGSTTQIGRFFMGQII